MGWPLTHVRKAASTSPHGNRDNSLAAVPGTRTSVGFVAGAPGPRDAELGSDAGTVPVIAPHTVRRPRSVVELARQRRPGGIRRAAGGTAKW
jgi:hypothetical protein